MNENKVSTDVMTHSNKEILTVEKLNNLSPTKADRNEIKSNETK